MRIDKLPSHPLLIGLYHVVPLSSDRVQIANAGRSVVLSGEGFTQRVLPLLEALDGHTQLDDLRRRFPELVPDVLEALAVKGMLTDGTAAPSDSESPSADAALALSTDLSPGEIADIVASAVVAVVGCGPVGSTAANLLAKAGVGRLLLCDSDEVRAADVSLSPPLSAAQHGQPRAEATRTTCIGSATASVETTRRPSEHALKAAGVDLAVLEIGYEHNCPGPSEADALRHAGIPFLMHTQDALEAVVGPLVRPGRTPCHRCALIRFFSNREDLDEHLAYRAHRARVARKPDAFLGAHCSIVAGIVAVEALCALVPTQSCGNVRVIGLRDITVTQETVLPVPDCASCVDGYTGGAQ